MLLKKIKKLKNRIKQFLGWHDTLTDFVAFAGT